MVKVEDDHCNGKPHIKALHSFKVSVLKMLTKVGQKEVDTSLSLDQFNGS